MGRTVFFVLVDLLYLVLLLAEVRRSYYRLLIKEIYIFGICMSIALPFLNWGLPHKLGIVKLLLSLLLLMFVGRDLGALST